MWKITLVVMLCACWCPSLLASVNMEWVNRYNSPGISEHKPAAMVTDEDGNVYVTGWGEGIGTGIDYVTVKYYANGDTAWVRTYAGPGVYWNTDQAHSVAVDDSGNVFVAGWSTAAWHESHVTTVKYDQEGNECWVQRYPGTTTEAHPVAMVTSRDGNIYVAAYQFLEYLEKCWLILGYGPDGSLLWDARYGFSGPRPVSKPSAVAADDSGNVYVTGFVSTDEVPDWATIKYHPNGDTAWVRTYDGSASGYDEAFDIALDDSGNAYVAGYTEAGNLNFLTIKYYPNGDTAWVRRRAVVGGALAYGVALDGYGGVYVTGYPVTVKYDVNGTFLWEDSLWGDDIVTDAFGCPVVARGNTDEDFLVIKLSPTGHELWRETYDGTGGGYDLPVALAVDRFRNVYVAGESFGEQNWEFATLKYDPNGSELWVRTYSGPLGYHDYANGLAVDDKGCVYVTGQTRAGVRKSDFATIRYHSDGTVSWLQTYNGTGDLDDRATAIALHEGNAYVAGASVGICTNEDYEYVTMKYLSTGACDWIRTWIGPGNYHDVPTGIALDDYGGVYVTGYSVNAAWTSYDYITVAYDVWGTLLWTRRYDGPDGLDDRPSDIAYDGFNSIYVTGASAADTMPPYSYKYATVKYDLSGSQLWVREYAGPGYGSDSASALAVDELGNIYVTGYSYGGGTDHDFATIKYDSCGSELWVRRYNGLANSADRAYAIGLDATGNIYVTGSSYGASTDEDYVTVKYGPDGSELWVRRYDGPASSTDRAYAMAVTGSGYVFVTGESRGLVGASDYATVAYDRNGNELWVERYNGPGDSTDVPSDIAVDGSGNIYVTGWSFGDQTLFDYATIKYSRDFLYGDANGDGVIEPGDVVYLINYLFRGGPAPDPLERGDCNCDGEVGPGDVVYLINYLFRYGPPPCP